MIDLSALMARASPRTIKTPGTTLLTPQGNGSLWPITPPGHNKDTRASLSRVLFPEDVESTHKFNPLVIMFIGRRGKGKSLAMTALAHWMRAAYKEKNQNTLVAANYQLRFADFKDPYIIDMLATFPDWGRDLLLCVDEIGGQFSNRRSMTQVTLDFVNFLTQIRKRNVEMLFTTQFPQMVDYQVLLQVDLIVHCNVRAGGRVVDLFLHDYWGQWTGYMDKKPWPPRILDYDKHIKLVNTRLMFPLYNTREVVPPMSNRHRSDTLATEGWVDEMPIEDQPEETALPAPRDFNEFLARQQFPFNPMVFFKQAQDFHPGEIESPKHMRMWLVANGWNVHHDGAALTVLGLKE